MHRQLQKQEQHSRSQSLPPGDHHFPPLGGSKESKRESVKEASRPPTTSPLASVNVFDRETYESLKVMFNGQVDSDLIRVIYQDAGYDFDKTVQDLTRLTIVDDFNTQLKDAGISKKVTTKKIQRQRETAKVIANNPMTASTNLKIGSPEFIPINHPNMPPRLSFTSVLNANQAVFKTAKPKDRNKGLKSPSPSSDIPLKVREEIISHDKVLILMRGVPGSGKSTLSTKLCIEFGGEHLSTDNFFYDADGTYNWNPDLLEEAHKWNEEKTRKRMKEGRKLVIVDNTNIEIWEMIPYAKMSRDFGYHLIILEPETEWKYDAAKCAKHTSHGVQKEKIEGILLRFDKSITAEKLLQRLEPKRQRGFTFLLEDKKRDPLTFSDESSAPKMTSCELSRPEETKISKEVVTIDDFPSRSSGVSEVIEDTSDCSKIIIPPKKNKIIPSSPTPLDWDIPSYPSTNATVNDKNQCNQDDIIICRNTSTQTEHYDFARMEVGETIDTLLEDLDCHQVVEVGVEFPLKRPSSVVTHEKGTEAPLFPNELIWEEKIAKLKDRFPGAEDSALKDILSACHGNLEWTLDLMTAFEAGHLDDICGQATNEVNDYSESNFFTHGLDNYDHEDMVMNDDDLETFISMGIQDGEVDTEVERMDNGQSTASLAQLSPEGQFTLQIDYTLAVQLNQKFGPPGGNAYDALRFPISDKLAKMIYQEWCAAATNPNTSASCTSALPSTSSSYMSCSRTKDFSPEVEIEEFSKGKSRPQRDITTLPLFVQRDIPVPKTNFEEIMQEEEALQQSRQQLLIDAAKKKDMLTIRKELDIEQLMRTFPALEVDILESFYTANRRDVIKAITNLREVLSSHPSGDSSGTSSEWIRRLQSKEGAFVIPDNGEDLELGFAYGPRPLKKNDTLAMKPLSDLRKELEQLLSRKKKLMTRARDYFVHRQYHASSFFRQEASSLDSKIYDYRQAMIKRYLITQVSKNTAKLDLHEFYVDEALAVLQQFISWKKKQLSSKGPKSIELSIVTGWGKSGTVPKLKPAVENFLQTSGIKYSMENQGCFRIVISAGSKKS